MRVLADTNIVARLAQPAHHQHQSALQAVELLLGRDDDPLVVPQVIYEFWVIATKPASANGLQMTVEQVQLEISRIRRVFTFQEDDANIFPIWEKLVVDHKIKGKTAHDARLVAAMMAQNISHILTFNSPDFDRYPGINVLTPERLVKNL